jgi:sulfur carrier protein
MVISVNGQETDVQDGTTLAAVVALLTLAERGVAVAIDRTVVPRSLWPTTSVRSGARIEILVASAGG